VISSFSSLQIYSSVHTTSIVFVTLNSAINPVLYSLQSDRFRKHMLALLPFSCCSRRSRRVFPAKPVTSTGKESNKTASTRIRMLPFESRGPTVWTVVSFPQMCNYLVLTNFSPDTETNLSLSSLTGKSPSDDRHPGMSPLVRWALDRTTLIFAGTYSLPSIRWPTLHFHRLHFPYPKASRALETKLNENKGSKISFCFSFISTNILDLVTFLTPKNERRLAKKFWLYHMGYWVK